MTFNDGDTLYASQLNQLQIDSASLVSELKNDLSSTDVGKGASTIGYRYNDVYGVLSRMLTQSDFGADRPYLGRNLVADQLAWDAQVDQNLMHRGSIFTAKKTRGIRQHATVLSVRANSENNGAFTPQVAGSDDLAVLSAAGALDSVAFFSDNYALGYETWENVSTADYTATTCQFTDTTSLSNILAGDFIKTKHASPYIGIVTGIVGNIVSVQKWVVFGTSTVGTPSNGTGLYINPVDKIWGQNTNILFDANTRATRGAIVEYGVSNKGVSAFNNITGVDSVILPESTYGAGSAFRARSSNIPARWQYGYEGGGSNIHNVWIHDSGSLPSSKSSYMEDTSSAVGFLFSGKNGSSSLSFNNPATGTEASNFTPWGHEGRGGRLTGSLTTGQSPSAARRYLINNSAAMSIVLPDPTLRIYGEDYEFVFTGTSPVTFTSAVGTVNGQASIVVTPTNFTSRKAMVGGSSLWYLYA